MRRPITHFLLTALLCALGATAYTQGPAPAPAVNPTRTLRAVPNFVTLTDQIIRAPRPEDWLISRGNYQAWGYSPVDRITKSNVRNL